MYDADIDGAFCVLQRAPRVTKPFQNWKKATEIRAHERSAFHITASQALLITSKQSSVVYQMQKVGILEKEKIELL